MKSKIIVLLSLCMFSINLFAQQNTNDYSDKIGGKTSKLLSREIKTSISPDGQISLDSSQSFSSVTMTRIGADGKLETLCTADKEKARSFLAGEELTQVNGEHK